MQENEVKLKTARKYN